MVTSDHTISNIIRHMRSTEVNQKKHVEKPQTSMKSPFLER